MTGLTWTFYEESGAFGAELTDPRRDLTIAWDAGDRSLYLSVRAPQVANVQGSQERLFTAPLSLLAALLLLPAAHHERVIGMVTEAHGQATSGVMAGMQRASGTIYARWPECVKAGEGLTFAQGEAEHAERLALDLAAAGAFADAGVPV